MIFKKRSLAIPFLLLALVGIILCLILVYIPRPPASADFVGYKSNQPLNGLKLQDSKLVRTKEYGLDMWHFDYIHVYESGVTVYQRKIGEYAKPGECSESSRGDYTVTCAAGKFMNESGKYAVIVTLFKGELASMNVSALLEETEFYVAIPKEQMKTFVTFNEWQQYFDSLESVDLTAMSFESRIIPQPDR